MTDLSGVQPATPPAQEADRRDQIEYFLAKSAVALVALIVILVFGLVFFKITPDATEIGMVMAVVTPTVGLAIAVYAFFYGSSKGSQDKSAQIAALTPPPAPATPPTPQA